MQLTSILHWTTRMQNKAAFHKLIDITHSAARQYRYEGDVWLDPAPAHNHRSPQHGDQWRATRTLAFR